MNLTVGASEQTTSSHYGKFVTYQLFSCGACISGLPFLAAANIKTVAMYPVVVSFRKNGDDKLSKGVFILLSEGS